MNMCNKKLCIAMEIIYNKSNHKLQPNNAREELVIDNKKIELSWGGIFVALVIALAVGVTINVIGDHFADSSDAATAPAAPQK